MELKLIHKDTGKEIFVYDELITGVLTLKYFVPQYLEFGIQGAKLHDLDLLVNDFLFPKTSRIVSFMYGNRPDLKIETYQ